VSRHGNALAAFRKAVEESDAHCALKAAGEMEKVGERDALELCLLLARNRDPRYGAAARRWLVLLAGKSETTIEELALASTAFVELQRDPASEAAWEALAGLVRAR
jgi:hypothetical protein